MILDEEGEDVEEENDVYDDYFEILFGWWLKELLVVVFMM